MYCLIHTVQIVRRYDKQCSRHVKKTNKADSLLFKSSCVLFQEKMVTYKGGIQSLNFLIVQKSNCCTEQIYFFLNFLRNIMLHFSS